MNDSLIRKFCESRYRWPIIATATLLLGLVALLLQVDDYFDKRNSHNVLTEDLDLARETADSLPKFEGRVAELAQKLDSCFFRVNLSSCAAAMIEPSTTRRLGNFATMWWMWLARRAARCAGSKLPMWFHGRGRRMIAQ